MTTLHKTRAPVDPAAPTMVVQMTVEALRELVREVQAEVLADHAPAVPVLLGWREAGLDRATFAGAIKRGELAGYRCGRRLVTTREDLRAWLEHQRVPTDEHSRRPARDAGDELDRLLDRGRLRPITGGRK